jgi:hypothetical protein
MDETFEGRDVTSHAIAVTNAGDGLSASIAVSPTDLHLGDEVYVILKTRVAKIRFEAVKDSDFEASRVATLKTTAATITDLPAVRKALEVTAAAVAHAKELKGQMKMTEEQELEE